VDRTGTSGSLDSHLPASAVALDNVNVALPRHRVSSSEGANEGEDERDEEQKEKPAVDRRPADDGEDDHQNNQNP
jgi:hypothetical protein